MLINLADCKDPDDPQGRSYRQINSEKVHSIPIGSLVEDVDTDIRLFVVYHARDCDQTPLYCLAMDPENTVKLRECFYNDDWINGYPEHALRLIRLPGGLTSKLF